MAQPQSTPLSLHLTEEEGAGEHQLTRAGAPQQVEHDRQGRRRQQPQR
jgi:hypothetical protein